MKNRTFLERARGRHSLELPAPGDPGCEFNVARLKRGLEWFTKAWNHIYYNDQVGADFYDHQWSNGVDLWLLLEGMTRRIYGWAGCPMAPERCDTNGPILCETCAELALELTAADQQPLFNMSGRS